MIKRSKKGVKTYGKENREKMKGMQNCGIERSKKTARRFLLCAIALIFKSKYLELSKRQATTKN